MPETLQHTTVLSSPMKKVIWLSLALGATAIFLVMHADHEYPSSKVIVENDPAAPENVARIDIHIVRSKIVNYDHGLYYFPFTGAMYGNVLSAFLASHPNLERCSDSTEFVLLTDKEQTSGGTNSKVQNICVGHFVTFTEKTKRALQIKKFQKTIIDILDKLSINNIISIDESSIDTHISNNYGWSKS